MFTIKKLLSSLIAILVLSLLSSCGTTDAANGAKPKLIAEKGDTLVYHGGSRRFIAKFENGAEESEIFWRLGAATIVREAFAYDEAGLVLEDSLWLEWNELPAFQIDSIEIDSVTYQIDTLYVDTISVSYNLEDSDPVPILLKNITPTIDTVKVGDSPLLIRNRSFSLPAHRSERLRFTFAMSDAFAFEYNPQFDWGQNNDIHFINKVDSFYTFEWTAPETLTADTITLQVGDSRGGGVREYQVHRFTYNESGSLWVGAGEDLVKVSSEGQVIFEYVKQFQEISAIVIHPNRPFVWVADRGNNSLIQYNHRGEILALDSGRFNQPTAMALDVQSDKLWVADLDAMGQGRMQRFDASGGDSLGFELLIDGQIGPVTSISMDQFEEDLLWFAVPEGDRVGMIRGDSLSLVDSVTSYNRPSHIVFEGGSSRVWVGDSSTVYLLDETGTVLATRAGYGLVTGLAAGPQGACVSDGRQDEVIRYSNSITGDQASKGGVPRENFNRPIGVAYEQIGGACWVADRESGTLFKLNEDGTILMSVGGFDQPNLIAVHQGVE